MNDYYMEPSDKKSKKWMITYLNKETGRPNTIYFGQKPYQDFTQHKTEKRKNLYIKRHSGMGEDWNNPSAGFFSRWLLWNLPDFEDSIKDTQKRFDIKIHLIKK